MNFDILIPLTKNEIEIKDKSTFHNIIGGFVFLALSTLISHYSQNQNLTMFFLFLFALTFIFSESISKTYTLYKEASDRTCEKIHNISNKNTQVKNYVKMVNEMNRPFYNFDFEELKHYFEEDNKKTNTKHKLYKVK